MALQTNITNKLDRDNNKRKRENTIEKCLMKRRNEWILRSYNQIRRSVKIDYKGGNVKENNHVGLKTGLYKTYYKGLNNVRIRY